MSSNRDFLVGDWVEVKFSGRVKYNDIGGSETLTIVPDPDGFPHRFVQCIEGQWVTLTERPPKVKVGDVVTGPVALKLPVGSVVLYEAGGGASLKVNKTEWTSVESRRPEPYEPRWLSTTPFKVLHVGGVKKSR